MPTALYPPAESLLARALGIIHSPRATFQVVVQAPRWLGVVTLTFFITAGCAAVLLETEVGQLALLDQWERTASAFGQTIDDNRYAAMDDASQHGSAYAALSALIMGPVLTVGLAGLVFASFRASPVAGRVAGRVAERPDKPVLVGRSVFTDRPDEPVLVGRSVPTDRPDQTVLAGRSARADRPGAVTYRQVLAVAAHAGIILALRQVIAAPITYARETLANPMTLGMFLGMLDEASLPARFFGIIDLFVIWWIVVLAIGLSVLYPRSAPRLTVAFVGAYVTLAVVLAVVMAVTGGTA